MMMIDVKMILADDLNLGPRFRFPVLQFKKFQLTEKIGGEEDQHSVGGEIISVSRFVRNTPVRNSNGFNSVTWDAESANGSSDADDWTLVENITENSPIPDNLGAPH